jgi:2-succinyl-5-enolpyruvyl-6-hydroxy-3-cyclohexene-1-carboxylate synthase
VSSVAGLRSEDWAGRPDKRPWVEVREPGPDAEAAAEALMHEIGGAERGVIVCGPTREAAAVPVARLAAALGWPVLAEPTSGVRCGPHDRSHVVAHYDVLLRSERFAAEHLPEVALRVGDMPTSKPLRAWLAGTRQVVVDPDLAWHEPTRVAETMIAAPATSTCDALAERLGTAGNDEWVRSWRQADALVAPLLAAVPDPFEPAVYAALASVVPAGTTIWVSSSMPIRDVEAYFPSVETPLRFLSNRGANGIDGVVSSALGAAIAGGDDPTVLLTGDLALVHDAGGVLAAARTDAELAIVCVNNGGGGIFDALPLAEHADRELYEEHIATPAAVDVAALAALGGFAHVLASSPDEVRAALAPRTVVEVRTERTAAVRGRRELVASVMAALDR